MLGKSGSTRDAMKLSREEENEGREADAWKKKKVFSAEIH